MFWLHSGSKDGFERKQGDFLVESKNIRRSHSARAYCILSYFHTFNILKTSRIAVQLEVFTYYHISSAINICLDISPTIVIFSGGKRTNDMLSLTDAYHQYPGYYTPTIPCIEIKHVSCSRGKMQKAIHQEKNLSTRGKCKNLSTLCTELQKHNNIMKITNSQIEVIFVNNNNKAPGNNTLSKI